MDHPVRSISVRPSYILVDWCDFWVDASRNLGKWLIWPSCLRQSKGFGFVSFDANIDPKYTGWIELRCKNGFWAAPKLWEDEGVSKGSKSVNLGLLSERVSVVHASAYYSCCLLVKGQADNATLKEEVVSGTYIPSHWSIVNQLGIKILWNHNIFHCDHS